MGILAKIALTAVLTLIASLVLAGVGCCAYDHRKGSTLHDRYMRILRCGIYGMVASAITLLAGLIVFIWIQ